MAKAMNNEVNNELFEMVKSLKDCIQRLTSDHISQEDKDKEAQWIGETHELLIGINPNYQRKEGVND
jgi:hypothetical protein